MNLRFAAYALLVGMSLAGCTSGDPSPSPSHRARAFPTLTRAWSAPATERWQPGPTDTAPPAWTTPTSVIVPGRQALTSYVASSGAKQWSLALPDAICTIADAPNADGIAAVLLGHGSGADSESCAVAAAVDTRHGRLLWTRPIDRLSAYGLSQVQIGDRAVAITNSCDTAVTLSVRDGAQLARLPAGPTSGGCHHTFASDGRVVVEGQSVTSPESLIGYDAVTGRRLWSAPVAPDAAHRRARPEAKRVISSDPLVVDASVDGHRFLRSVDAAAGTSRLFGRQASDSFVPVFTRRDGSRILIQYGESQVLFAYDAATGRESGRTVLDPGETAVGLRGAAVITLAADGAGLVVRSTDPISGHQVVLGTGSLDGASATFGRGVGFDVVLSGDLLVLTTDRGTTAYRLPETGTADESATDRLPWGRGDVRPRQVADLCPSITPATKRAFGFAEPELPAPAACGWGEPVGDYVFRNVSVSVAAVEPTGQRSAVAAAKALLAGRARPDSVNHLDRLTPFDGLGDEALLGTRIGRSVLVRVMVRRANVVIEINALGDGAENPGAEGDLLESATRRAAADLVRAVDRAR